MHKLSLIFLCSCAGLLIGCGSDGGSSSRPHVEPQTQRFQLGLLRADEPTTVSVQVAKPLYCEGSFELAEVPGGAFAPVEGILPLSAESGPDATMWITFTPPAASGSVMQEGAIELLFCTHTWGNIPVTLRFEGEVETPSARLLQTQVSAGDVVVGETGKFGTYLENTSVATPITVTEVTAPGGDFSIAPDAFGLPAQVAPGSRFFFRLQYSPTSLGTSSSVIQVYHSASDQPVEATLVGTGIEDATVRLLQTDVSAGKVVVGEKVQIGVDFENTSALTTVKVTGLTLPGDEFSLAADAPVLPVDVAPGATLHIPLVYAPAGVWDASAVLLVRHSVSAEPLEVTLSGTGLAPQVVTYYDVLLDTENWTFESQWQYIDVPAEAVSIFIEATGDSSSLIDLIGLEGQSGTIYENYDMTGPLGWLSNYPAGGRGYLNVALPNSEDAAVQLESGGGTYWFRLRDTAGMTDRLQVRVTVVQRTGGTVEEGTLDLRVFLADGLAIDPTYAMDDARVADMMKTLDAILGTSGIRLGNISFIWMDPYYDVLYGEGDTEAMIAQNTAGFPAGSLNVFLVTHMDYGIASVAGAVPGPTGNGTPFSGIAIDFNETDGITLGAVAAHQVVHYLGAETENVVLEPGEEYPALRHPLLHPSLPPDLLSPPESTDYAAILETIEAMPPMEDWCGTCTRTPAR
jgi:hypothetical protein